VNHHGEEGFAWSNDFGGICGKGMKEIDFVEDVDELVGQHLVVVVVEEMYSRDSEAY
jgi:hypothetical protein